MKAFLAIAALAPLVVAQSRITGLIAQLPSCALAPLASEIPKVTGCGVLDYSCSCKQPNLSKLVTALTPIILAACGVTNGLLTERITTEICVAVRQGASGSSTPIAATTKATATMMTGTSMTMDMASMTMDMNSMSGMAGMTMTNMATTTSMSAGTMGSESATAAASTSSGVAAKLGGSMGGAILFAAAVLAL